MMNFHRILALTVLSILAFYSVANAQERFTPENIWEDRRESRFFEDWIGGQLNAMEEPSLWQYSKRTTRGAVYRLLELPSFEPATAIRIVIQPDGTGISYTTRLNGAGGYAPGQIRSQFNKILDREGVEKLQKTFEDAGFWVKAVGTRAPPGEFVCTDGAQYVIEAMASGKYKFITRHLCELDPKVSSIIGAFDNQYLGIQSPYGTSQ